ncbi:hypothetical protein NDU88_002255 [Pleurodeles waltl]|uniref:Uncharacterized protein n=1 Tax=Pleurodeles waltl TaxID=8319 RepID=A0AAV7Q6K3_PLEWA|nr:hypothetical protein NDU88_002255 [Pleurodeles waltl]
MGQPKQCDATRCTATSTRQHGEPRAQVKLDIEEIIRAAREAAKTRSKDWILNQIRGLGVVEGQSQATDQAMPPKTMTSDPARLKSGSGTRTVERRKGTREVQASSRKQGCPNQAREQRRIMVSKLV